MGYFLFLSGNAFCFVLLECFLIFRRVGHCGYVKAVGTTWDCRKVAGNRVPFPATTPVATTHTRLIGVVCPPKPRRIEPQLFHQGMRRHAFIERVFRKPHTVGVGWIFELP